MTVKFDNLAQINALLTVILDAETRMQKAMCGSIGGAIDLRFAGKQISFDLTEIQQQRLRGIVIEVVANEMLIYHQQLRGYGVAMEEEWTDAADVAISMEKEIQQICQELIDKHG